MATTFATKNFHGATNSTTAVDVVTAPASSTTRDVRNVTVHNRDTAPATVILQLVDSSGPATRRLCKVTIEPDATLEWDTLVTLDATTKKLQVVLDAAITTNQLDWAANFGETVTS